MIAKVMGHSPTWWWGAGVPQIFEGMGLKIRLTHVR